MIRHHPAESTLIGYASGTLLPLHAQVVDIHLAQCSECRTTVALGEEVGSALLEALAPMDMMRGARSRPTTSRCAGTYGKLCRADHAGDDRALDRAGAVAYSASASS